MGEIDDEVAEVQAVIDGLRARLEAALAEVGKARIDPTGPGHHKARRWARGEERRYTLRWLRAHGNLNACEAADSIEAGEHRPEGRHGVPAATEWDNLRTRAEAAEQRAEAARDELVQVRAELKQARADALLLAVLWNGTNRNRAWFHLADDAVGLLDDAERAALTELWDNVEVTNDDVVALLRRALGDGHET